MYTLSEQVCNLWLTIINCYYIMHFKSFQIDIIQILFGNDSIYYHNHFK